MTLKKTDPDDFLRQQLKLVVKSAKLMLWKYDVQTGSAFSLDSSISVPGLPEDGMQNLPQSLLPYLEESSIPQVLEFYRQMETGNLQVRCELWYKATEQRGPLCTRINGIRTVTGEDGRLQYVCVAQDVTLEKRVNSQYEHVMSGITRDMDQFLAIAFVNVTRNTLTDIYSSSKAVRKFQHVPSYDVMVENFSAGFSEAADREQYQGKCSRQALLQSFHKGEDWGELRFRYKLNNGALHWLTIKYSLARNPLTGDIEGISYVRDVDKEVQREQVLRRLTDWDFENIGLISLPDLKYTHLSRNVAANHVLPRVTRGYDEEIAYVAAKMVVPEQREDYLKNIMLAGMQKNLEKQSKFSYSVSVRDETGEFHRKLLHCSYLDEGKHTILLTAMDITDSYLQHMEEMKAVQAMLLREEKALKYRNDFFSNISHDMRTPLNGILGFTDLALESGDQEQVHQYLHKIKLSGGLLLDLINDTLMLSKLESGKLMPHYEVVDNRLISGRVLVPVQAMAAAKGVTLVQDRSRSPHVLLKADRVNTQKIFINLISNAVKFTPAGGKVEVIMEQLEAPRYNCNYRFIVRDTGIGIAPEFLPHIFEPFTQEMVPQTIKDNTQGTGLGLTIVHKLVQLLQGHLEVESEKGKGTTFTVFLPMPIVETLAGEPEWLEGRETHKRPDQKAKEPAAAGQEGAGRTQAAVGQEGAGHTQAAAATDKVQEDGSETPMRVKILLCEDNLLNQEIAATVLRKRNYLVETALNGQLGVEKFKASAIGEFGAILMDLRMPVLDGYGAAKAIRRLPRADAGSVPIIALSADAYDENIQQAKEAGMNAHLSKPLEVKKLFLLLEEWLNQSQGS